MDNISDSASFNVLEWIKAQGYSVVYMTKLRIILAIQDGQTMKKDKVY